MLLVLLADHALAVVLTGGLAQKVGNIIGLGNTAVDVWNIAKWPVLLLVVSFMFALLYWAAPNVKQPGFRWVSPGGILAVVGWLIASAAFAFYVGNFGSYNKTYGALGGVIVFLVWLWISNIVILLGAEFNAELERGRAIEGGMRPEDREPFAEPRDTRKMDRRAEARVTTSRDDGAIRRVRPAGGAAAAGRLRDLRGDLPHRDGGRRGRGEAVGARPAPSASMPATSS